MNSPTNTDRMWDFVTTEAQKQFSFLVSDHGFANPTVKRSELQCSVEYTKPDIVVGIWTEYGTRPELFVKKSGKRLFARRLIAQCCPEMKIPVAASTFGRRFSEDDYRTVLAFFAHVLQSHASVVLRTTERN